MRFVLVIAIMALGLLFGCIDPDKAITNTKIKDVIKNQNQIENLIDEENRNFSNRYTGVFDPSFKEDCEKLSEVNTIHLTKLDNLMIRYMSNLKQLANLTNEDETCFISLIKGENSWQDFMNNTKQGYDEVSIYCGQYDIMLEKISVNEKKYYDEAEIFQTKWREFYTTCPKMMKYAAIESTVSKIIG